MIDSTKVKLTNLEPADRYRIYLPLQHDDGSSIRSMSAKDATRSQSVHEGTISAKCSVSGLLQLKLKCLETINLGLLLSFYPCDEGQDTDGKDGEDGIRVGRLLLLTGQADEVGTQLDSILSIPYEVEDREHTQIESDTMMV